MEPTIDICAAKMPSTVASAFSATARPVSPRHGVCRLASSAMIGSRIMATIGASINALLVDTARCTAIALRDFLMKSFFQK
jgi:hypothetical protein